MTITEYIIEQVRSKQYGQWIALGRRSGEFCWPLTPSECADYESFEKVNEVKHYGDAYVLFLVYVYEGAARATPMEFGEPTHYYETSVSNLA